MTGEKTKETNKVQLNFLVSQESKDKLDKLAYFLHQYGFIETPQRSKLLDFMAGFTYNWLREYIKQKRERGGE